MGSANRRHEAAPLITVGLPIFNGADYIEDALNGLLQQSFRAFRVVVSDNASTDGTWAILQDWASKDSRLRIYRQSRNLGAAANYRYLVDQANTPYFMWHAYDDWLAPNYLEQLFALLEASPRCALACGTTVHLTPEGVVIREIPFPNVASLSRIARLRCLLRNPESARVYGLYRTDRLVEAYAVGETFGFLWAADHLIVLSLMVGDELCGTSDTVFYWRRTGISTGRYRPSTFLSQLHFSARYLRFHLRLLRECDLATADKFRCLPSLLVHANRTIESFFQRPLRRGLRQFLKRGVRWVREAYQGGNR